MSLSHTDKERIRDYLQSLGDWSWAKPTDDEYVSRVAEHMAVVRREHPDGEYPAPIHGMDDLGACPECDALRVLERP